MSSLRWMVSMSQRAGVVQLQESACAARMRQSRTLHLGLHVWRPRSEGGMGSLQALHLRTPLGWSFLGWILGWSFMVVWAGVTRWVTGAEV